MTDQTIETVTVFVHCNPVDPKILDTPDPFEVAPSSLDIQACLVPLFNHLEEAKQADQSLFAIGTLEAYNLFRKTETGYRPYYMHY